MISVLVLTLNEEENIERCLESLPSDWRRDLVVLDSDSSDDTVGVATRLGAKVITNKFENYAAQRNFGFSQDFQHDWVLMLDADERMTPELTEEIRIAVSQYSAGVDMYRMRRKDMFNGRWLKRSSGYPTYFPRLFRVGTVVVQREINEEYNCEGDIVDLKEHLLHYPFNKGLKWWFERHIRYAYMEAEKLIEERENRSINVAHIFFGDHAERRAVLKQIAYRLPFRPTLVFLYLYVLRFGFLDGYPGLTYAQMRRWYEQTINVILSARKRGSNR